MDEQQAVNGHDKQPQGEGPVSQDVAALAAQLGQITGPIKIVIETMVRGLLLQTRGAAGHVVLNAIAWQTGNLLATCLQGDLSTMFMIRKGMLEAFADGVKKAPLVDPAAKHAQQVLNKG